jgi:hypothetical protein
MIMIKGVNSRLVEGKSRNSFKKTKESFLTLNNKVATCHPGLPVGPPCPTSPVLSQLDIKCIEALADVSRI